ncbi:glycosyltransferase [Caldifermentibacillus hisashii]|uniref:tetratricopeptide repeat-containing glycosyltransferase family 2 protein n=1 Tax=Caldifermentibacillus hisashii TaxID=996558 RepID=UPI002E1A51C2|nr:glycosyltransferase [Caldifermentibacillus hisashii]
MKPFLSICMIVKNEENLLRRCLDSIKGIADEIIIADTGSVDKTKDIALEYTDMVFDYTWEDDFSKARNFAASKASGEWIFVIDADEFVDRDSFIKFKEDLKNNPPDYNIFAVQIVNFVGINGKDTSLNYHERLYKNDGLISYYRSIHELLKHKESKERRGFSDFQIYHSGYMKNIINEKEKSNRNLTLLKKKKEKEPIDYYFLGNEYDQLGDLDKAIKYYQKGFQLKDDLNKDWVKKLLLRLVNTLHKANRNKEALEIIDSCEQIYPYLVDFKFYRGKIHFDEEDYENAKEVFEEILRKKNELKADSSNDFLEYLPYKLLGEIYESENELHLAVHNYSRALSINDADDYLWMRLINLLAKHSSLEELANFLNNNLLNKPNVTPLRVIKILLSVPNINVQKLTRSFLEEPDLSSIERESLYIKNLLLDGDINQVVSILHEKTNVEIVSLLAKSIFSIIDFIILALKTKKMEFQKILFEIKFDKELNNLLNVLFNKKRKKLNSIEEELFVSILQQTEVIAGKSVTEHLNNKIAYISPKTKGKIKKMRSIILNS